MPTRGGGEVVKGNVGRGRPVSRNKNPCWKELNRGYAKVPYSTITTGGTHPEESGGRLAEHGINSTSGGRGKRLS